MVSWAQIVATSPVCPTLNGNAVFLVIFMVVGNNLVLHIGFDFREFSFARSAFPEFTLQVINHGPGV